MEIQTGRVNGQTRERMFCGLMRGDDPIGGYKDYDTHERRNMDIGWYVIGVDYVDGAYVITSLASLIEQVLACTSARCGMYMEEDEIQAENQCCDVMQKYIEHLDAVRAHASDWSSPTEFEIIRDAKIICALYCQYNGMCGL